MLETQKNIAIIFDLDGTMIDNSKYHRKAWTEFAKRHGKTINEDKIVQMFGSLNKNFLHFIFNCDFTPEETETLAEEKETIYREMIVNELKPVDGLIAFLELLKKEKIIIAVATSAPPSNVGFVLGKLKIPDYFNCIVDASQVINGKPDSEIFIKAAGCIGIDPEICIVIEDSPYGIKAAKAAKMKVIGILTSHTPEELKEADWLIKNYNGLNKKILNSILNVK